MIKNPLLLIYSLRLKVPEFFQKPSYSSSSKRKTIAERLRTFKFWMIANTILCFPLEGVEGVPIVLDPDFIELRTIEDQVKNLEATLLNISPENLINRIQRRSWLSAEQNEASIKKIKTFTGILEQELTEKLRHIEDKKNQLLAETSRLSNTLEQSEAEKEQALQTTIKLSENLRHIEDEKNQLLAETSRLLNTVEQSEAEKEKALQTTIMLSEHLQLMKEETEQNRAQLSSEIEYMKSLLEQMQNDLKQKEQELTNLQTPYSFSNHCLSPLPLASWFNLILLDPFFDLTPLQKATFAITPYAFRAPISISTRHIQLLTTGLTLHGSFSLSKDWLFGCGLGYSYSAVDWNSNNAAINNIYFGPSVNYSSKTSYFRIRTLGGYSHYHLSGECAKKVSQPVDGWNFDTQVSGGLNFFLPAHFSITPQFDLNYTLIFLNHNLMPATLESSDFFRSKIALQTLKKCFFSNFLLTPQLSLGLVWMKPLSQTYKKPTEKPDKELYPTATQLYINFGIAAAFQNSVTLLFAVESYICRTYPTEKATLKIEWNW